jgi:hypothetical protein
MSERKMIMERLLSVAEAADRLGTTARFPRRLIAEKEDSLCTSGPPHSHPRVGHPRVHRGRHGATDHLG